MSGLTTDGYPWGISQEVPSGRILIELNIDLDELSCIYLSKENLLEMLYEVMHNEKIR